MNIKDIAAEAGYSVGTVSRVLNNHPGVSQRAKRRVLETAEKYRFYINSNAKHLKQADYMAVAIIVKGTDNMLFASIVEKLQDFIYKEKYDCLIHYINEEDNEVEFAIKLIQERQPKGILFLGSNEQYFKESFAYIKVPCVMVANSAKQLGFSHLSGVCVNDREAAKQAIVHLIKLGHRNIAVIGGSTDSSSPSQERYLGVIEAFKESGIDFNPKLQYESTCFSMEGGYCSMKKLLERYSELSAVFAMSDVMAIGAMRAVREAGLNVPEDVSVVGFDGVEIGKYLYPMLTTVKQPMYDIAKYSFDTLMKCIDGDDAVHTLLPFSFQKRGSSAHIDGRRILN
ncbi:LacI family DNA-binding transcriptional regulator [Johnsonella ignava]|uniref:LacI family DNA-binding transcriptional regulator n=1 Tax=Johnsonella ignava TaxID=43995 RepID=UPI0023F0DE8D|nr:LacI family DNA-binding transcriptional regulator [Johnsonella ignava]